jgi:uncharacterized protein (DUF433 family)
VRWQEHLLTSPHIMAGAVCYRGTRIPVSVVLDNLAAGLTEKDLLAQYPTLPAEAASIALAYAADLARERIVAVPA